MVACLGRRLIGLVLLLIAMVTLAVAWKWSPLSALLDINILVNGLQRMGQSSGMLVAVAAFCLAVTLAVPVTLLVLVTLVAFGPWMGFVCAMSGALLSAGLSYGLGRLLGREAVRVFAGARANLLSKQLGNRGLLAVAVLRLVPIAPFAIVNMVAGASQIRLRDMLLGTLLGMMPSMLAMMVFADQIVLALSRPSASSWLLLVLTVVLFVLGAIGVRRWMRHFDVSK